MSCELIVYACPTGLLADQIEAYFAAAREIWAENPALAYMPHCSLTGFFHDTADAIPRYIAALDAAHTEALPGQPAPAIRIADMLLREDFHGLALESAWLKQVVVSFAHTAHSPTRTDALRLKDWLHLSFAYGFPADHAEALAACARSLVDPLAPVAWELRLYERLADKSWHCHAAWPLAADPAE